MHVKRMAAAGGVAALAVLAASTLTHTEQPDVQANNNFGGAGATVTSGANVTNVTATSAVMTGPVVAATFFGKS